MAQTDSATTNFNQTVVALVNKNLEELLRAPLPHLMPGNFIPATFVKGTNNTMRFLNIPDLAVTTNGNVITPGTAPWLSEGIPPTPGTIVFGYEEFSAGQAGILEKISDIALARSPLDLLREIASRIARQAIATVDLYIATLLLTGTNVMYAGAATSSTTLVPGNILTGALVKLAVAKLGAANVPTFADGTYHAIVQPGVVFDLMSDTTVGGWIDAKRYAGADALFSGELGEYAGVRFTRSTAAGQRLATVGTLLPAVTAAFATDIYTSTAHGLVAGNRIRFSAITGGGSNVVTGVNYYVIAPVTANTFKIALTPNGTSIDLNTSDITAATTNYVYDVNSTIIFGPGAYVFGDWQTLETKFTPPGGRGDELEQSALIGWKGNFGAMIVGQGASASNVSAPRYIRIETVNSIS